MGPKWKRCGRETNKSLLQPKHGAISGVGRCGLCWNISWLYSRMVAQSSSHLFRVYWLVELSSMLGTSSPTKLESWLARNDTSIIRSTCTLIGMPEQEVHKREEIYFQWCLHTVDKGEIMARMTCNVGFRIWRRLTQCLPYCLLFVATSRMDSVMRAGIMCVTNNTRMLERGSRETLLVMWPWTSYLMFLCLIFSFCQ